MNKVFLIGRLTKDPELRYTSTNTAAASFTIAVKQTLLILLYGVNKRKM